MSAGIDLWLGERFRQVSCFDFYRGVFPSGSLDARGAFTKGKYTAIAIAVSDDGKVKRHRVCDDLKPLGDLAQSQDFVVMSPVAYAGKTMRQENARELYALTFDVDGLLVKDDVQVGLENLFTAFDKGFVEMPRPTFTVSSGNGIHLYWVLDKPIRLFPNTIKALWKFRVSLTRAIWQPDVTSLAEQAQFESVTQSFRVVGSLGKDKKTRVKAFKSGEKISLSTIQAITEKYPELAIPTKYESTMSLEEAKKRYPKWYEDRIVSGKPKGTWRCNRALYEWWKRKVVDGANRFRSTDKGAQVGHRYWAIFALAVYARKCGVPRDELEADALELVDLLDSRTTSEDNHFTRYDAIKALEAYDARYITVPRHTIEQLTNIEIPPNKRNGRTRQQQIAIVNATNAVKKQIGEDIGRPNKKQLVADYYRSHPNTTVRQCAEDLCIAPATAQKWLKTMRGTLR